MTYEDLGQDLVASVPALVALMEPARTAVAVPLEPWERRTGPDPSRLIRQPPVRKPEPVHAPSPNLD